VDVLIDRRELLEKAHEKGLPVAMMEKDYVLGWLLFGLSGVKGLIFKGGTALSKVYFPRTWRLSEDLDFVFNGAFQKIIDSMEEVFQRVNSKSRLTFNLRSSFSNPGYLQLKIQYDAVLGKNWIKIDVTKEAPIDRVVPRELTQAFSDYPTFRIEVEGLEEIGAQKLRSLIERKKCRDFYDAWRLLQLEIDRKKLRRLFLAKCKYKAINVTGPEQVFPGDLKAILKGYWEKELGRLVRPVPDLDSILRELRHSLAFLWKA
jgi:uncharacterized protein